MTSKRIVTFRSKNYECVFTQHARDQMKLRNIDDETVFEILESGEVKEKGTKNKFWVFKALAGRKDNLVSVSIAIESPKVIVITTMVNWRPQ